MIKIDLRQIQHSNPSGPTNKALDIFKFYIYSTMRKFGHERGKQRNTNVSWHTLEFWTACDFQVEQR